MIQEEEVSLLDRSSKLQQKALRGPERVQDAFTPLQSLCVAKTPAAAGLKLKEKHRAEMELLHAFQKSSKYSCSLSESLRRMGGSVLCHEGSWNRWLV